MTTDRWPLWQVVLATVVGVLLYLRSPIDLLPDRMGPLGFVDDLILVGVAVMWLRRRAETAATASPREEAARRTYESASQSTDPYEILGVARTASPEEITRAYREQMKRYHPDRVADLGPELQRVAHERTVAIQRAYDTVGKR
jgi:uncharacterized membrane protein YkvA (DUF1232 family)